MPLSIETRKLLLVLARRTIAMRAEWGRVDVDALLRDCPPNAETQAERGAFVSIHRGGELRGCIGNIGPHGTLHNTVMRNAEAASTRDTRFAPVRATELPQLEIEISALTPLEPFSHPDEIQVGVHGIFLSAPPFQGVLLPQVATQRGWSAEEFLHQTAVKAGMAPAAWQSAQLFRFAAEVFSEKDLMPHDPA